MPEAGLISLGNRPALHNWEPSDADARALIVLAETDLGKRAWQQDDDTFWVALAAPDQWQQESAPGVDGVDGSDGLEGADGEDGADGAPGSVWRNGSGVPDNGTGVDGDYYLRTSNSDVYQRQAGTYTVVGNIKGTDGTNGNTTNRSLTVLHTDKSIANTTHDKINNPGFTKTLVSGHSYKLRWAGRIQCATSSGGAKFRLNGTAVMNFLQGNVGGKPYSGTWSNPWFANWTGVGDGGNPLTGNSAANSAPGLTAYFLEIELEVSVLTGGTLYLEAAENVNNSALVFKAGFILEIEDTTLTS